LIFDLPAFDRIVSPWCQSSRGGVQLRQRCPVVRGSGVLLQRERPRDQNSITAFATLNALYQIVAARPGVLSLHDIGLPYAPVGAWKHHGSVALPAAAAQ